EAEPDNRLADEGWRPVNGTKAPWPGEGSEIGGRCAVKQEGGVGALLQEAGGHPMRHGSPHRSLYDLRLLLAGGHHGDPMGVEDSADAHRQGLMGHVVLAKEVAGRIAARDRIERGPASSAVPSRAGFIKTNVSGSADTQHHEIDAAGPADFLFVAKAIL